MKHYKLTEESKTVHGNNKGKQIMKHEISTYILIGIGAIIILAPQYDGWRILGDRFATWKNDGYLASEAREAVELLNSVSARKMK